MSFKEYKSSANLEDELMYKTTPLIQNYKQERMLNRSNLMETKESQQENENLLSPTGVLFSIPPIN